MPARFAALDLGSNSFRLQIAKMHNQRLVLEKRIREPVRLAAFLDENKNLRLAGFYQAAKALANFHQKLKNFENNHVLATGTFALRSAQNKPEFLPLLEDALGFPIRVLSGEEEARYIFYGMQATLPKTNEARLFIDIGGGSTEIICGAGNQILTLASIPIGCVTQSLLFFKKNTITKEEFAFAQQSAAEMFAPLSKKIVGLPWKIAFGSSGSVRATMEFLKLNDFSKKREMTKEILEAIVGEFLKTGDFSRFKMGDIRADRRAIMPAGFSILLALFNNFHIQKLRYAKGALCQGLLSEMAGLT